MSETRFRLGCTTDEGGDMRYCRGDLVLGFALRDIPGKDGMITTCMMIGKGRRAVTWQDIGGMLRAMQSDPAIDNQMLQEAVAAWLDDQQHKEEYKWTD